MKEVLGTHAKAEARVVKATDTRAAGTPCCGSHVLPSGPRSGSMQQDRFMTVMENVGKLCPEGLRVLTQRERDTGSTRRSVNVSFPEFYLWSRWNPDSNLNLTVLWTSDKMIPKSVWGFKGLSVAPSGRRMAEK